MPIMDPLQRDKSLISLASLRRVSSRAQGGTPNIFDAGGVSSSSNVNHGPQLKLVKKINNFAAFKESQKSVRGPQGGVMGARNQSAFRPVSQAQQAPMASASVFGMNNGNSIMGNRG